MIGNDVYIRMNMIYGILSTSYGNTAQDVVFRHKKGSC